MLQQTQVATVVPYYTRFMERFPDVDRLAGAQLDQVLHCWSGLGYYARARHLHATARIVCAQHAGRFPETFGEVLALPGIGPSTAGAILALACGQRHPILDGNVRRVLTRFHAVEGWPGTAATGKTLWSLAEEHTPARDVAAYTQAIMDLGATVCTRRNPACAACPLHMDCRAHAAGAQADFPTPRKRRKLPVRATRLLLLCSAQGELLLEKRPPVGIWGGLWSLPELAPGVSVEDWCREHTGMPGRELDRWPVLRHTFSHFHLDITPVLAVSGTLSATVMETGNRLWHNTATREERGFAAPVHRLVQRFSEWQREQDDANGTLHKTG